MKRLMIKKTQSQYSVCDHKTKAKPVNATFKWNTARKEVKKTPIVSEYSSTAQYGIISYILDCCRHIKVIQKE